MPYISYGPRRFRYLPKLGFTHLINISILSARCIFIPSLSHSFDPIYKGLRKYLSVHLDGVLNTTFAAALVCLIEILICSLS